MADIGLWGLEIHELAIGHLGILQERNSTDRDCNSGTSRASLLHCGLLFPGSTYESRAKLAVHRIVEHMSDTDKLTLRVFVFAALFAPGQDVDVAVLSPESGLSLAVQALVTCSTHPISGTAMHAAIYAVQLANLLAQEKRVFCSASGHHSSISKLTHFLRHDLVTILTDGDVHQQQRRRLALLPLLSFAFCDFHVWHSTAFGTAPDEPKQSTFLIGVLKRESNNGLRSRAVAGIFKEIVRTLQKELFSSDQEVLEKIISLTTHACCVVCDLAYERRCNGQPQPEWRKEFIIAKELLGTLSDKIRHHRRYFDSLGLLHRRQFQAHVDWFKQHSEAVDQTELESVAEHFRRGVSAFTSAADKSQYGWANPLVG